MERSPRAIPIVAIMLWWGFVVGYLSEERQFLEGINPPTVSSFYTNLDKLTWDVNMWFFDPIFPKLRSETLDDDAM
eukprot:CAMPEP_0194041834 /NCGR_PEP_ID=MMETSP0009_2-20130614/13654_1 /TAXON_ID=210454 /ORGANISM="Grammatophora oceanica, Strain CCMP 410" /LENGTH=75 /DNA_ID=CAMNT_0038685449 /DNA_START=34 /DNA_END=261 /DNA_ORIENTATION=-